MFRMSHKKNTKKEFEDTREVIHKSCLKDFEEWVEKNDRVMEETNGKDDIKTVYSIVNRLSDKSRSSSQNLMTTKQVELLKCTEDIVQE